MAGIPLHVNAQDYIEIRIIDQAGRGLPLTRLFMEVQQSTYGWGSDDGGLIRIWDVQRFLGTHRVTITDTLGNRLNADAEQISISRAGQTFLIRVSNARVIRLNVSDEGGGPPPISALFLPSLDIAWGTVNRDGLFRFTMITDQARVMVGSPLRKMALTDVPSGGDQSINVQLKRAVSLGYELSGQSFTVILRWDNVELHDVGRGRTVPYVVEGVFTTPDGSRTVKRYGPFTLTVERGEKRFVDQVAESFINGTVTLTLYMDLSYSYSEERYWEKVNAHGDPWVWELGIKESRYYRTGLITSTVSLEALGLRAKYDELSRQLDALAQKYESASRTIDTLNSENQRLRNELTAKDNKITSLENEKKKLESDLNDVLKVNSELKNKITTLESEKTTLQQTVNSLQGRVDALQTSLTQTQNILYPLAALSVALLATTILVAIRKRS